MVAYAIWATNSKSEVRPDLRGRLEAKIKLFCWLLGTSKRQRLNANRKFFLPLTTNKFFQNSSKILQEFSRVSPSSKFKLFISLHVSRIRSIRSKPCSIRTANRFLLKFAQNLRFSLRFDFNGTTLWPMMAACSMSVRRV